MNTQAMAPIILHESRSILTGGCVVAPAGSDRAVAELQCPVFGKRRLMDSMRLGWVRVFVAEQHSAMTGDGWRLLVPGVRSVRSPGASESSGGEQPDRSWPDAGRQSPVLLHRARSMCSGLAGQAGQRTISGRCGSRPRHFRHGTSSRTANAWCRSWAGRWKSASGVAAAARPNTAATAWRVRRRRRECARFRLTDSSQAAFCAVIVGTVDRQRQFGRLAAQPFPFFVEGHGSLTVLPKALSSASASAALPPSPGLPGDLPGFLFEFPARGCRGGWWLDADCPACSAASVGNMARLLRTSWAMCPAVQRADDGARPFFYGLAI